MEHQNTTPAADFVFNRSLRTKLSIESTELNLPGQTTRHEGQWQPKPAVVSKYGSNTSLDDNDRIVHESDFVWCSEAKTEAVEKMESGVSKTEEIPLRRSRVRQASVRFGFSE